MIISKYSPLFIRRSSSNGFSGWNAAHAMPGIISLFAALHRSQEGAISIASEILDLEDPAEDAPTSPDTWSVWARYGAVWRFRCSGAVSLDDLALPILEEIEAGIADEIRVCPPGTPEPARLS